MARLAFLLIAASAFAQTLPPPQMIPTPGPATDAPYAPTAILPGGIVLPLYPPGSPMLNAARVREPEQYNMSQTVPGRINSIVNIHNPSIEVHLVDPSINTGSIIILAAGGGHNTLNVGGEAADQVHYFYNFGINTAILRNRLRRDGYEPRTDGVNDALQAIRLIRTHAAAWRLDPNRIGIMGFSAGAELASAASVLYPDPAARPDFAGMIYPGPSPFAHNRTPPPIPPDVPPSFTATPGSGDRVHAIWALEYYQALLEKSVPNIELHVYGHGVHPGQTLPDGSRATAGLTDRRGVPFGTWQLRFIDWFRDLGFLSPRGTPTKAAQEVAAYVSNPPRPPASKPKP